MFNIKDGFDVIIGNPSYIRVQLIPHADIDYFKKNYQTAWRRIDISILFFERFSNLLTSVGTLCFISTNQFILAEYGKKMRRYLLEKKLLYKMLDFGYLPIFENTNIRVSIFFLTKKNNTKFLYSHLEKLPFTKPNIFDSFEYSLYDDQPWDFSDEQKRVILEKIKNNKLLKDFAIVRGGIISGLKKLFIFKKKSYPLEKELSLDLIRTENIGRYYISSPEKTIFYPCYLDNKNRTSVYSIETIQKKFPLAYEHIIKNKIAFMQRKDSRQSMGERKKWWQPVRFGQLSTFSKTKILSPGIVCHNKFTLDTVGYAYSFGNIYSIILTDDSLNIYTILGILNSSLIEFYLHLTAPVKQGGYYTYSATVLENIPLHYPSNTQIINAIHIKVIDIIKAKNINPNADTDKLEKGIDELVYKLYGITDPKEIAIIESSLKKDKPDKGKSETGNSQKPGTPP